MFKHVADEVIFCFGWTNIFVWLINGRELVFYVVWHVFYIATEIVVIVALSNLIFGWVNFILASRENVDRLLIKIT